MCLTSIKAMIYELDISLNGMLFAELPFKEKKNRGSRVLDVPQKIASAWVHNKLLHWSAGKDRNMRVVLVGKGIPLAAGLTIGMTLQGMRFRDIWYRKESGAPMFRFPWSEFGERLVSVQIKTRARSLKKQKQRRARQRQHLAPNPVSGPSTK